MRRLRALNLRTVAEYCELLRGPQADRELPQLLNVLTTNHTAFFRERHHFDHLRSEGPAETVERAQRGSGRVRIWCAASSTGEEPYSIAGAVHAVSRHASLDVQDPGHRHRYRRPDRAEKAEYPREVVERAPGGPAAAAAGRTGRGATLVRMGAPLRKLLSSGSSTWSRPGR